MKTELIQINPNNIDRDKLRYAAELLREGGLVAFPTETVYGLGANALNSDAVRKIFLAKGRPSDNPLIVHIAERRAIGELVQRIPANAVKVMDHFWPGPITLVLPKSEIIPPVITAGLDTVAVRMPSHPVALELIRLAGVPVAAPSANTSGKPSPTCAAHVMEDLQGRVDIIIDAGCAEVGVESTVLDVTIQTPMILRPGGVTREELVLLLGDVDTDPGLKGGDKPEHVVPKAPGMKYTHYAPKADVVIVEGPLQKVVEQINAMLSGYLHEGKTPGVLATEQTRNCYGAVPVISMGNRDNPETIAAGLFNALRQFDSSNVEVILAEAVESQGIGVAVMNRMVKAAGYNVVKV